MKKAFYKIKYSLLCSAMACAIPLAQAASPVVNTTIAIEETGTAPWDSTTWNGTDLNTAGTDANADNNVVRMQDTIVYRVEVSVNDSDVDDLTATVDAVNGQVWQTIPNGCKTDAVDVTSQPVSSISADGTELFCNLGPAIEGTARVFKPAALTKGVDPKTGSVILNDTTVAAQVNAGADGNNNMASAGPVETTVTANFKVDLIKQLKVTGSDPNTGKPYYVAPVKKGPGNEDGSLIEYVIKAKYAKGSMIANGADEANGDFTANYTIVDVYTDDNDNNDGAVSTGGILYDWDASKPACELVGDNGTGATVNCTQLAAAIDDLGPAGVAPDGLTDGVIQIDLANIDVRDPDADSNLFEIRLNIWFSEADDIANHQICAGGGACVNTVTNRVGVLKNATDSTLSPFDEDSNSAIVSTEDASNNNLPNYNAGTEPFPNEISYPLVYTTPGGYHMHKSFNGIWPYATRKQPDQDMAPGETRPFLIDLFDYRKFDGAVTQACDKIDTNVFEYAGVAPPNQITNPSLFSMNNGQPFNPVMAVRVAGSGGWQYANGGDYVNFYYSNKAHTAAGATQAEYLEALRTNTCDDDINGDGVVNIVDKNGNESNPGNQIDWWENPDDVPGGMAAITLVRQDMRYDQAAANAVDPAHTDFAIAVNHLIKAKDGQTTGPYGSNNRLPNFASYRRDKGDGVFEPWRHVDAGSTDPDADATFSVVHGTADRMTLIASSQSLQKYTGPLNMDVVKAGDKVDFILKPQVLGQWTGSGTATLNDNLPTGTTYVAGSEQFSVDGGTTWLNRAAYDASNPAVTIATDAHTAGADPLIWEFGSVETGEQLPLVKYTVLVDPSAVSGTFKNTATLNSGAIGNDETATAPYIIRILPQSGLDVVKSVDQAVYSVNKPFTYNLIYKNLGGQDYASGEFIDIFPFNGDGSGTTSGLASAREPATTFSGSYQLTGITATNGEIFFATDAAPASIPQDVCHEDNQAAGYKPTNASDLCYAMYTNNGNQFSGGGTAGTGAITWTACAGTDCSAVANATAVRFTTPAIPKDGGGKTVSIKLDPIGNRGGTPALDADGNVTAASTGDIYTNNFGGRVPEISLQVISNDVSVTMVAGSIGDYVWLDTNADGVQDASEAPLPGTELALLDGNGNPIYVDANGNVVPAGTAGAVPYTATTDANGLYLFENLPDGDYQVKVTKLPMPSLEQTFDADGIGTGGVSAVTLNTIADPITGELTGVDDNREQDFGYQQLGSIGDTIYHDKNNDGVIDADEGLAGIKVTLTPPAGVDLGNGAGQPITTTTNSDGTYLFENLPEGDYIVKVDETTLPAGLAGNNTQDPDGGTGSESAVSLGAGEQNLDQDFGYYAPGMIGDTIYHDKDNDGVPDAGEGIAGVTVTLTLPDGTTRTTTTDADGKYLFDNLPAGDYTVKVEESTLPAELQGKNTVDPDGGNDSTSQLTLGVGESNLEQDFGYRYVPGSIGDTIYHDMDNDGVPDAGEELSNVTVSLTPPANIDLGNGLGQPITTTTNPDGTYLFDNLPPGDYTVAVDESGLPAALQGNNTQDPDGGNDSRSSVSLSEGENNLDQDFGYYEAPSGQIGDTIYHDANNNGVVDPDEGIPGVMVTLELPDGSTQTATTDNNGQYLFDNLSAGDYTVTVNESDLPDALQGHNTQDPDGGTASQSTLTLANGESNLNQDFGYFAPGTIGDTIYHDANNNGIVDDDEGIPGVTVTLELPDGSTQTATTDNNGQYLFDNLAAGDYTVTVDESDLPDALQGHNTQDPDGGTASQSTLTLASGESNIGQDFGYFVPGTIGDTIYHDANNNGIVDDGEGIPGVTVTLELPDGSTQTATTNSDGQYLFDNLAAGDYTVTVDESDLPDALQGHNTQDPDGGTASQSTLTLASGESNTGQDFGYFVPGTIGDTIYHDANNNGIVDDGEGIPGVTVTLELSGGGTQTATTDINGQYLFDNLPAGDYTVTVNESTLPPVLQGNNTQDPDDGTASQSTLTLASGESNIDQNFGYFVPGTIGDTIYHDIDNDGVIDAGEGLVNVTVTLTLPDGSTQTTRTDNNGQYLFTGLPAGNYTVTVEESTLPTELQGNNTQDPDGGTPSQSTLTLADGESNLGQDFGYAVAIAASDDTYTTPLDTPVVITPLINDTPGTSITEINGVTLTGNAQSISVPNGTVEIDASGNMTFVPNPGYTGSAVFPYTISNGTNTATANVTVTIDSAPITATDDTYTTSVDTPVNITPLLNDQSGATITSLNGVPLTGGPQTIPVSNGRVEIDAAGNMVFVPSPGYTGPVRFPYTIRDNNGNIATAYVNITIPGGAPAPIPSSSIWSLLLLVGLMGLFANRRRQQV